MKLLIINTETGETFNYNKIRKLKIEYNHAYSITIKRSFNKKYVICFNPKFEKLIIN